MKLNAEQIKFIDTYLENSDVNFADIRMEMVDHVASSIENEMKNGDSRAFYDIFKGYMVVNKASLLNDNQKFIRATDKKLLKLVFKTMLSWKGLIFFGFSFIFLYLLSIKLNQPELKQWFSILPVITILVLGALYFGYFRILKLDRFSAIERMGFVYFLCFQIFHLMSMIAKSIFDKLNNVYSMLFINFGMLVMFSILLVTIRLVREYKRNYKVVN
jgi:hypothetical protein